MTSVLGKRISMRVDFLCIGFGAAALIFGGAWHFGSRGSAAEVPTRGAASDDLSVAVGFLDSAGPDAKVRARSFEKTPATSANVAPPAKLRERELGAEPVAKSAAVTQGAPANKNKAAAPVSWKESSSTVAMGDTVLARSVPRARARETVASTSDDAILRAPASSKNAPVPSFRPEVKGKSLARLGLPPLAEMERECRRASLQDSMPPSYCSCEVGEFEQMDCRVSTSITSN